MQLKSLSEIKKELNELRGYEIVIYGSYAKKNFHSKSDIDIAVIGRKKSYSENVALWKKLLRKTPDNYDLKIFELLPLEIKMSVIKNYKVLFGEQLEISEYFYHFRKLWEDVKLRFYQNQFSSFKEKLRAMKRAKAIIKE